MKRRLAALMCALVLLIGIVPVRAITEADIYFTSINNHLLPLTADTMPEWVDGAIYVPYTLFDSSVTGMDLGVLVERNRAKNTVAVYTLRQMLIFNLSDGSCMDHTNETMPFRSVMRNGRPYLPVEAVCDIFGLRDSYVYTRYGYLVRICNAANALSDERFVDAASELMRSRAKEFLDSQRQPVPDTPVLPPDDPVVPPEQDQPKEQVLLYLAFQCKTGEGLETIMNSLDRNGSKGIFFLSTDMLVQQDDLVRRMVGSGHCIGLLVEEGAPQTTLEQGNRLLRGIARTTATAVYAPDELHSELEEQGWRCWDETLQAVPNEQERSAAYAQRMINAIGNRKRSVYLTLDDSARTASVLDTVLQRFKDQEYTIVTPIETRL